MGYPDRSIQWAAGLLGCSLSLETSMWSILTCTEVYNELLASIHYDDKLNEIYCNTVVVTDWLA